MLISRRALLQQIGAGLSLSKTALAAFAPPGKRPARPIRLDRNGNAYGASPKAIAAMRAVAPSRRHRYSDAEVETLRAKIAAIHGVGPDHVLIGAGSRDVLRMAIETFTPSGKKAIAALPTFDAIGDYARRAGCELVAVPLTKRYAHDLNAMLARTESTTGLAYICNPNNPTGSLTPRTEIEEFLRRLPHAIPVVVDEAYHHYVSESSDYVSFIDRPIDDQRLIVLRSFSKVYGLAGIRVGYAVAAPQMIRQLAAASRSETVSVAAAVAAAAALDDLEHVRASVKRNTDDRQQFLNQANARMLRAIDSHANFVMIHAGRPAAEIVAHLKKHDVLVPPPFAPFDMHVRVSLGLPDQIREFWRVWDLASGTQHRM